MGIFKKKINKNEAASENEQSMLSDSVDQKPVDIKLSVHPNLEGRISDFQMEYLKEELYELDPLNENQVNISTIYAFEVEDKLEVSIYIRNALSNAVNFEDVPLLLVTNEGTVLAQQIFDLRELGTIPPLGGRPWKLYFNKQNISADEIPKDGLKVMFSANLKALNKVNVELGNLPEDLQGMQKSEIETFFKNLPMLTNGEVNISVYKVFVIGDGSVIVTLIIRNGSNREIGLNNLPVKIIDANGVLVAKGSFKPNDIKVNPYKAVIYNFAFPKDTLLVNEFDLSTYKVNIG